MNPSSEEDGPSRPRVILMGSLGVAVDAAEYLLGRDDLHILGVVCSDSPRSAWRIEVGDRNMIDEAARLGLPVLSLDSIEDLKPDLGISVRFHQILRAHHLEAFSIGVVNLHGAPLPEMRGSMCDAAALLERLETFGTSIHWMNTGIDEGDILAVERFPIAAEDTVFDLFQRANSLGLELIKTYLDDILSGDLAGQDQAKIAAEQGVEARTYFKSDILAARKLESCSTKEQMWATARAFSFPGHSPAYVVGPSGKMSVWIDPLVGEHRT